MRPEAELRLAVARCSKEVYSGAGGIEKEGEKAIYVSFQRLAANFLMFLDNVPEQQPYY